MPTYSQPTILWRLESPNGGRVEAVAVPTWRQCTIVINADGKPKKATDYPGWESAIQSAENLRQRLERRRGWHSLP